MLAPKNQSSEGCVDAQTTVLTGNLDWKECDTCGDDVHVERWRLGYRVCKHCGDQLAQEARSSWCVIQEYGKGNYQYVTTESAFVSLKNTNQKQPRG